MTAMTEEKAEQRSIWGLRAAACSILFFSLFAASDTMAARKALLMVGNVRQWADFSYHFNGETSESSDGQHLESTEHRFEEKYSLLASYAVWNPRYLNGTAAIGLGLDQEAIDSDRGNSSGVGRIIDYNIGGLIFDRSPFPANFFSSSVMQHQQRPFARSYDTQSDSHGVGITLRNRYIPSSLSYNRNRIETSGLETDRIDTSDSINLSASHTYGTLSRTIGSITQTTRKSRLKAGGSQSSDETTQYDLKNTFTWLDITKRRQLDSSYRVVEDTGTRESRYATLSESLLWEFGKALEGGAIFVNSSQENNAQSSSENSGELWLNHRLFESVTTRLTGRGRDSNFSNGDEEFIAGDIAVSYQKKLPDKSLILVGLSYGYAVTDRNLSEAFLAITDERVPVPPAPPFQIFLINFNVIAESIVVRNALNLSIIYARGLDYDVEEIGAQTRLIFLDSGRIVQEAVTELSIDYQIQIDPLVKYSTTSRGILTSLNLFDNRYRIYASITQAEQDLISGRSEIISLSGSRTYIAGMESNLTNSSYRIEYVNRDSSTQDLQHVEASWRYTPSLIRQSLTVSVTDRYTMYGRSAFSSDRNSDWENFLRAGAAYRRPLTRNARIQLRSNYYNTRGSFDRDEISAAVNLEMELGKVELSFGTELRYRILDESTALSNFSNFLLRRYF